MRQLFLISFLAILVFVQINGEKVPVNEGAFEDGIFYRAVGQTFLETIEDQGYNFVQLTRILPFALLNLSFSTFHIVKDFQGIQNGMLIWQCIYLAIGVYWYFRIAKKLRAKTPLLTLGFILLFFNYAWLKEIWYHPFSPDLAAFAFGMGQVNYFLRYEKFKLGMVSVIGAFISPLLLISGLFMLFLPGDKLPLFEGERPKSAVPVLVAIIALFLGSMLGWGVWSWGQKPIIDQLIHIISLFALGVLIILLGKNNPINWKESWIQLRKRAKADKLNKGIMSLAGSVFLLFLLSGNNEVVAPGSTIVQLGNGVFRYPLDFLIGLILQWGILGILTILYLKRFLQELGKLGWSVVIILSLGLMFSMLMKPLALSAWIPLWTIILLKALKRYRWSNKDLIVLGITAIIISLAWLPVNTPELSTWLLSRTGELNSFAVQKWAIHETRYISVLSYIIVGLLVFLITYLFHIRKIKYQRILNN